MQFVDAKRKELKFGSDQKTIEQCLHTLPDEKYKTIDKRRISEWRKKITEPPRDRSLRNASRVPNESTVKRSNQLTEILAARVSKIRSVSHAHFMVMAAWKKYELKEKQKRARRSRNTPNTKKKRSYGIKAPCRTTVYRHLINNGWTNQASGQPKKTLSEEEEKRRTELFQAEIGWLVAEHQIPLARIFNADETAYRLVPSFQREWALKDASDGKAIVEYLTLSKAHTTLLCACTASGTILDPQLNWKGGPKPLTEVEKNSQATAKKPRKSNLVISDAELQVNRKDGYPHVRQFVQYSTHWTTQASFINYINTVILPAAIAAGGDFDHKWLLIVDVAGIHISKDFRKNFRAHFERYGGILAYIPPSMTDALQPLDISVFGPFKSSVKLRHQEILTKEQYQLTTDRLPFLKTTRAVRTIALRSIDYANSLIKPFTVLNGWCAALGATVDLCRSQQTICDRIEKRLSVLATKAHQRCNEERSARDEWVQSVLRGDNATGARNPRQHGGFEFMFFYGAPWDVDQEKVSAEWKQICIDEQPDPREDVVEETVSSQEAEKRKKAEETSRNQTLAKFGTEFGRIVFQHRVNEEAGLLRDDHLSSSSDGTSDEEDDQDKNDEEDDQDDYEVLLSTLKTFYEVPSEDEDISDGSSDDATNQDIVPKRKITFTTEAGQSPRKVKPKRQAAIGEESEEELLPFSQPSQKGGNRPAITGKKAPPTKKAASYVDSDDDEVLRPAITRKKAPPKKKAASYVDSDDDAHDTSTSSSSGTDSSDSD